MADGDRGFWTSFPGVLTGIAAVLTALGGLALALNQAGLFRHEARTAPAAVTPATTVAVSGLAATEPAATDRPAAASDDAPPASAAAPAVNLLTAGGGAEIVAASSDDWAKASDGDEATDALLTGEVIYALGHGKGATFDTFGVFVPGTLSYNLAEYELATSDAGPTGPFTPIGRFKVQNIKLYAAPFQEATFPATTARYLRFRIVQPTNGADIYELRLRRS